MKNLPLLTLMISLLSGSLLIFSCSDEKSNASSQTDEVVAELIQRNNRIQLGKEWESIQNNYVKHRESISVNPNDHKARLKLTNLFIKEARVTGEHGHYYPAALHQLEAILSDDALSDDLKFIALTTKAGVQLSLHEFESALQTGNQAALMNPTNAQIHGVLVDAHVELGNYDKAIQMADKMMSIKPDIRSYSRVSYLREIHGDVRGSLEAMKLAVEAGYPGTEETAWAMLTLGEMYKEYGYLDTAELVFKTILEMRPDYPFAVGAIGEVQMEKKDFAAAEATFKDAMNIIPEVGFYISLAHLYKEQGRVEEMNALVEEIFVMLNDDVESGHNMNLEYAMLYLELLEDTDKAMEYASVEYEKRPENIDVNHVMAMISEAKGDKEEMKKYVIAASTTNSKKPDLVEMKQKIANL